MSGYKKFLGKEPAPERFSAEEATAILDSIRPQDSKVLKALEGRRTPAEATLVAARAEIAVSVASDSLTHLGQLGLLTTTEFAENSFFVEVDNRAFTEVLQKSSL